MNARTMAAVAAGKLTQALLRRMGLGGGTALPGLVAATIDPHVLLNVAALLRRGSVIVTGTNGKTTTTRLLSDMLHRAGWTTIHNRSGSNMIRGMTSAAVAATSWGGRLDADIGVWEVDEATLPEAVAAVRPTIVVINNLFRDQLDRYGEVNTVAAIWEKALALLPSQATVVLNADDPRVARLGTDLATSVLYFGIEDPACALHSLPDAADSIHCLQCAHRLAYDAVYASHMGRYRCPNCGTIRPVPDVAATAVHLEEDCSIVKMQGAYGEMELRLPLPGLYNVYNVLAATAAAAALGLPPEAVQGGVASFRAAFGRVERLQVGDRSVALFLVKNPAGFNEVIRTVFATDKPRNVLICINDLLADGTDVSWLWDVDFEQMQGKVQRATVSGIRAADMALRLKYADVVPAAGTCSVETDIGRALTQALETTPAGETLFVLPTYTAMLDVKRELARRGIAPRWQDD